jgi:ABC-2 type transport system ATP-binding protein
MIDVRGLNFEHGTKRILHDINFSLPRGSVTALVGPNGAGKTTLLRCLSGLSPALSGSVHIAGIDVFENPRDVYRVVGYLSDFFGLYDELTVRQCLTHMAWAQKIPAAKVAERVKTVSDMVGLEQYMDTAAGKLSRGWRQRVGIALTLVHDPQVVILDEPASGMDPEARIGLSNLILKLKAAGKTLIVSSHILSELEDYSTAMLVIRDGRIVEHVQLETYKSGARKIIRLSATGGLTAAQSDFLKQQEHVSDASTSGDTVTFTYSGDEQAQHLLLAALVKSGIPVYAFAADEATLSDAYIQLTTEKRK